MVYTSHDTFTSSYIPEHDDRFLKLWPHRWDFIAAPHPRPDESPDWYTESRYPLPDRAILDPDRLYGVRFGAETSYFLIDIDRGSIYHPQRDRFAVGKICSALELLGITDHIAITSSYRGGVHLYFPLPGRVLTWQLAAVVKHILQKAGFFIDKGILEIFPNARGFEADSEKLSTYAAHRLPLQAGSYLLDWNWQIMRSDRPQFVKAWKFCEARNEINALVFKRLLRESADRRHKLSYKAKKFLSDLCSDIAPGWSGPGQTNFLLGRIALKEYVFGHIERGCEPLTGDRLTNAILETALSLPGYQEYCRHQPEIWERAAEWGRAAENSKYWPYQHGGPGAGAAAAAAGGIQWNEWQRDRARDRLSFALADMLNRGTLPGAARGRFDRLTQEYGFSGETLYKHRDLWHPAFLWKTPPAPPAFSDTNGRVALREHAARSRQKLIDKTGCNTLSGKDSREFWLDSFDETGCNSLSDIAFSRFDDDSGGDYAPG